MEAPVSAGQVATVSGHLSHWDRDEAHAALWGRPARVTPVFTQVTVRPKWHPITLYSALLFTRAHRLYYPQGSGQKQCAMQGNGCHLGQTHSVMGLHNLLSDLMVDLSASKPPWYIRLACGQAAILQVNLEADTYSMSSYSCSSLFFARREMNAEVLHV